MIDLTSVDVRFLVQELAKFNGAKIEKIVQGENKRDVLFSLYLKDHPKIHLRFLLPGLICTLEEKPNVYPKVPPGFAMFLRKYLGGARIRSVQQQGFNRVVLFEFEKKDQQLTLVVELIAPGNMVLLIDGKIKGLLENQNFKDRTLRGGIEYKAPPDSTNPVAMTEEELIEQITTSDRNSIVTTLAMTVSLGGTYAEEVCKRAGIEKQRNDLTKPEIKKIVATIGALLAETIDPHKDEPRAYPFKLVSKTTTKSERSFLAALGSFVEDEVLPTKKQPEKKTKSKLQTMLDAQEKQIKKMEKQAEENKRIGERIFEEYQLMQEILQTAKDARSKKQPIDKALKKFPQVKNYIPKTAEVEVELD